MKKGNEEFKKQMLYKYEINWEDGLQEILEPNDAPICWPIELPVNFAIVCASNPNGKKLSAEDNEKLSRELAQFIDALEMKRVEVRRLSLNERTLQVDGKDNSRAFLILDINETQAFVIANQFRQEAFVFFDSDNPTDLKVELIGCSWLVPHDREVIFRYESSETNLHNT